MRQAAKTHSAQKRALELVLRPFFNCTDHDCHKQHAHAPDKDIDRPHRHVDLIVHALLDGSVLQPLIFLLQPFILLSEFFQTLLTSKASTASSGGLSHSLSLRPPSPSLLPFLSPPASPGFTQQQQVKTRFASFPLVYRDSRQGPAQAWTLAHCRVNKERAFGTRPPPVLSNCTDNSHSITSLQCTF